MENKNAYSYDGDCGDIGDCVICSENKISSNLHCYECNKYICIACCNKLSSRTSLLFVEQTNNKHIRLFNKNEIISIYYDNLSQLSFSHKYNIALTNMYTDLDNENKMLIEELNSKNEYIKELEERLR